MGDAAPPKADVPKREEGHEPSRVLRVLDKIQQRFPPLGFPIAVEATFKTS